MPQINKIFKKSLSHRRKSPHKGDVTTRRRRPDETLLNAIIPIITTQCRILVSFKYISLSVV